MAISTNGTVLTRLAGALYNTQMSNATYDEVKTLDPASLANALYARDFSASTDAAVATTLVTNLGLASVAGLDSWVAAQLTAAGSNKGAKIVEMLNGFAQMTADATYGAAATAFNTKVNAALSLSQTTGNAGGTFAAAGTAAPAGAVFNLTTSADAFAPGYATDGYKTTAGNDLFRSSGDNQLNDNDSVDGGAGNDTLKATITEGTSSAEGAATVKPMLTSVENIEFTTKDGGQSATTTVNAVTLDLSDSTGVNTVLVTAADEVKSVVSGIATSVAVTLKSGGAAATAEVGYTGLSTVSGGGSDAATLTLSNSDLSVLTVAGIEVLTLNAAGKAGDVDNLVAAALEKLVITGGVNDPDVTGETFAVGTAGTNANDAIDFAGLDTPSGGVQETAEIDASGSTGSVTLVVDDSVKLNVVGGAGKLTLSNTSAGASAASATAAVTVVAGAGGVAVTLEGGANSSSDTAMTLVNVTGSAVADTVNIAGVVNPTNISNTTTDESKVANAIISTGAGNDTITIDAAVVNVDAGEGDDTIVVTTQSAVTSDDKIVLGAGKDTVQTSEAQLDTSDATWMAYFSGAEVIKTTATGTKVINIADLGTVTSAVVKEHTAESQTGTSAEAGVAAVTFTSNNATGSLTLQADTTYTGQAGGTSTTTGGAGAAGVVFAAKLDNGTNTVTLTVTDATTITGGAGGAGATNGSGGNGGVGVEASEYETFNLVLAATDTTADTVTFAGGAGGALAGTGSAGTTSNTGLKVGANATINITESISGDAKATTVSALNLNDVVGTNVTINAGTLTGGVTIDSTQGNVTITTGAGADSITTSAGIDTVALGGGIDSITAGAGADVIDFADNGTAARDTSVYVTSSYTGTSEIDVISNFDLGSTSTDDALDMALTAAIATAVTTAVDVSAATSVATDTITALVSSKGLITLGGTGAANVDTLTEWLAVVNTSGVLGTSKQAAFVFGSDTYVVEMSTSAGTLETVIKLVGVQATGLATSAGSSDTDVFLA